MKLSGFAALRATGSGRSRTGTSCRCRDQKVASEESVREQRCRVHKTDNVLNKLPKAQGRESLRPPRGNVRPQIRQACPAKDRDAHFLRLPGRALEALANHQSKALSQRWACQDQGLRQPQHHCFPCSSNSADRQAKNGAASTAPSGLPGSSGAPHSRMDKSQLTGHPLVQLLDAFQ